MHPAAATWSIWDAMDTRIEPASAEHQSAFLAAVRRSAALHRPWVKPPSTPAAFHAYLAKYVGFRAMSFFALTGADQLVGVINVSEIVRGSLQSAYLGYYAFAPHHAQGHMTVALAAVVSRMFRTHRLHRLEANIQPGNRPSIALVKRLGFRNEGLSPRYLKIGGRWRDHQRWAIIKEEWRGTRWFDRAAHADPRGLMP